MEEQEAAKKPLSSETSTCPVDLESTFSSRLFTSLVSSTASHFRAHVPSMEDSVKFSGGAVAALLAMRYAGSFHSACIVGLLSGLFAHSLYADILRKKRRRDTRQEIQATEERKTELT
ncbi:unnamed protein product [Peronospora destructor]|uniref:Cytochrome c oxidase assembly protein COX20, mitochondrial n=1 Tax=Peronospora destructor TaxID=86335 RepID=A0AAV0VCU2_9STRA|nr:unnamed protein product [Peronospora destructor]